MGSNVITNLFEALTNTIEIYRVSGEEDNYEFWNACIALKKEEIKEFAVSLQDALEKSDKEHFKDYDLIIQTCAPFDASLNEGEFFSIKVVEKNKYVNTHFPEMYPDRAIRIVGETILEFTAKRYDESHKIIISSYISQESQAVSLAKLVGSEWGDRILGYELRVQNAYSRMYCDDSEAILQCQYVIGEALGKRANFDYVSFELMLDAEKVSIESLADIALPLAKALDERKIED